VASIPLPHVLATPTQVTKSPALGRRHHRPDPRHNQAQPSLRYKAPPRRAAQAGRRGRQAYDPEVHERRAQEAWQSKLGYLPGQPCRCDMGMRLPPDLRILLRQVYAFFIVQLGSRQVVYAAGCRHPTQEWTTQQLRNSSMNGEMPEISPRDHDDKYGASFDRVVAAVGARVIKKAVRAPNMNTTPGRFMGSVRRELLDHAVIPDRGRTVGVEARFRSIRAHLCMLPHTGAPTNPPSGRSSRDVRTEEWTPAPNTRFQSAENAQQNAQQTAGARTVSSQRRRPWPPPGAGPRLGPPAGPPDRGPR